MSSKINLIELCSKDKVGEGDIIKVETGGLTLAVYNVEGEYFVTDDACTHGPGSLSEGYLEGHIIECDFHNGCFDIRNGEVVTPPCLIPLPTYKVVADDLKVIIEHKSD